jgi:predicted unusual protein kinase regulating ubiquinone biosynthesis (AarF/ABC1/UbiB family)
MAGREKPIQTGRVRRATRLGRLAGAEAAKSAATKAANLTRDPDGRRAAAERRQIKAAEQIVEVLGQMKGAAMKVGQIASFLDSGSLPPEITERLQHKLAELRDSAPVVPFADMRKVIERDLGDRLDAVFAGFDEHAIGAASIGQVYRATLDDGRVVAVKVQYPGVAQAVRADLQNLGLLLQVAKRIVPGLDTRAAGIEIRERVTEELDYEHEAQNQRAFARALRGHPFIFVPDVITDLCGEHTLVTEFVDGIGFEQVRELDQATRDRYGEIVFRFFFGTLYRLGHFSADPHPGNFLLMDDGHVAFLDFGMTKTLDRPAVELEMDAVRRGIEGDAAGLRRTLMEIGYYEEGEQLVTPERVLEHFYALTSWYTTPGERTLDRDYLRQVMFDSGDPRSQYWDMIRRYNVPPNAMLARRMEGLVLGVLSQLEARGDWHAVARVWLYGDPPATELGRAEAEFFESRGLAMRARAAT